MEQTYITLNNGVKISQLGMGVYMVPAGDATKQACLNALKLAEQERNFTAWRSED